ncbi:hypothetical protein PC115_g6773 [Phytophthora cactorum]|uniref:Hikeshi-like domain-containing protein n=1 Tax=Phytophthora cactorum TaxID=29920 RepID=A0A8T1CYP5_9STRA|nr:hypothetical protein PC115_g6773 [Phytophthora cactorum]
MTASRKFSTKNADKLQALARVDSGESISAVAHFYGVTRVTIWRWRQQQAALQAAKPKSVYLGTKVQVAAVSPVTEKRLLGWIRHMRGAKMNIAPPGIAQFGLVIAGRPVVTDFREIGPAHYVVDILEPTQVTDLTFFLLPGSPVPPGFGAVLYFAVPALQNWQLLGTVFAEKPSAIFRTSWPTHPDVVGQPVLQLGVSIESLDNVKNLGIEASGLEERKAFALKIAQDLFNYLSSFSSSNSQSYMTIPTNLLDKWMERFEAKYRRDPNFMMKNQ